MQPQANSTHSRCPRREGTGMSTVLPNGHLVSAAQCRLTTSWNNPDNTIFPVQFTSRAEALTEGPPHFKRVELAVKKLHSEASMCETPTEEYKEINREEESGDGIRYMLNSSALQCEGFFFFFFVTFHICLIKTSVQNNLAFLQAYILAPV